MSRLPNLARHAPRPRSPRGNSRVSRRDELPAAMETRVLAKRIVDGIKSLTTEQAEALADQYLAAGECSPGPYNITPIFSPTNDLCTYINAVDIITGILAKQRRRQSRE
jgi:hypothetical protein